MCGGRDQKYSYTMNVVNSFFRGNIARGDHNGSEWTDYIFTETSKERSRRFSFN